MLLVVAAGCGSGHARKTCERAATRYEGCVREILGSDMATMVHDKQAIGDCADDARTVKMYDACLDAKTCDQFMDCLDSYASSHQP